MQKNEIGHLNYPKGQGYSFMVEHHLASRGLGFDPQYHKKKKKRRRRKEEMDHNLNKK
jgi:hypothetical protein